MTCVELQESLVEHESGASTEQQVHLKSCAGCAALLEDLLVIASSAGELRESDEPSPRVWNSLEIALRQEGLIKRQRPAHSLLPSFGSRWGWARWLAPAAALLLITTVLYLRQHSATQLGGGATPAVPQDIGLEVAGLNDDDLMQEAQQQPPALQALYTDNLRRVNQYIQDEKDSVEANPNDEEARRSLMEAYQEKALLFQLALDRSLP